MERDIVCPHCGDDRQIEVIKNLGRLVKYLCNTCSKTFWVELNENK